MDDTGKVTAVAAGTTTITVTTTDGSKTANCVVTVTVIVTEEYVDLGLPSGLKWATKNLGASKPSDYGNYYAWGETTTKSEYTEENHKWGPGVGQTKYKDTHGKTTVLEPEDDAATA